MALSDNTDISCLTLTTILVLLGSYAVTIYDHPPYL